MEFMPPWLAKLDEEDVAFIKRFVLSSGSLKEMARQYEVTYPTVRLRLDRLIDKIKTGENSSEEPYISLIKKLALNEKMDFDAAKILITEYRKLQEENKMNSSGNVYSDLTRIIILIFIIGGGIALQIFLSVQKVSGLALYCRFSV